MKKLMFGFYLMIALMAAGCGNTAVPAPSSEVPDVSKENVKTESLVVNTNVSTAEQALMLLKEGNARFVADDTQIINVSSARRAELEKGQSPYAVVVSCSDSRITPTHVFNAGLGELFEIRIAGNVLDDYGMGSVEYGIEHLNCPLLVVMGHENCGAVTASVEAYKTKKVPEGEIGELVEAIMPSVEAVKASSIEEASHKNVQNTMEVLHHNPIVEEAIKSGKLRMIGAYYNLDGRVTFLD